MSVFEARHIAPEVKKAIFKKIEALNKIGITTDNPTLDPKGDTTNSTPSFDTSILEPVSDKNGLEQTNALSYQLVRNTFVRLSVDIPVENSDGEEGSAVLNFSSYIRPKELENRLGTTTQTNTPLAFNKSPFTNDKKFIWRGHTGITGVSVTQKSFFVKEIKVNWECPDPIDFEERVLPFFLQHGRFMVVEFGWGLDSDLGNLKIPPLTSDNMTKFLDKLDERNKKSVDSYQAEAGTLTTYDYSITEEGGYKGTMTIISRGQNVLYTPIQNTDDDEESVSIRRFTPTKDKDVFQKAVEQTITFQATINKLEDFITDYLEEPKRKEGSGGGSTIDRKHKYKSVNIYNPDKAPDIVRRGTVDPASIFIKYIFKKGAMKTEVKYSDNYSAEKSLRLESAKNMYCSWGWFEDVILNSFFQTKVTTKDNADPIPFMEIRSVHSPYRYELSEEEQKFRKINATNFEPRFKKSDEDNPTPTDIISTDELVSNRCNNNSSLTSLGFDSIILPGQYYPIGESKGKIERILPKIKKKKLKADLTARLNNITYLEKLSEIIDDNFKPFGNPNEFYGKIRNMVFSVDFIKSHFQNINSVEEGLRSLWSEVSAKYGGFFAFMIYSDTKNNGRIGICDRKYMNPTERNEELLKEPLNFEKYIEGKKELGSSERLMEFSVFSKDSIITSYNLNLQLTKEAATLALYGNQGKLANGNFTNSTTLYDEGIQKLGALQNAIFSDFEGSDKIKLGKDKSYVDPIAITGFSSAMTDDDIGLDMGNYNKNSSFVEKPINNNFSLSSISSITQDIEKIKEEISKKLEGKDDEDEDGTDTETTPFKEEQDKLYPLSYDRNGSVRGDLKKTQLAKLNHSNIESDQSDWVIQKPIIPIDLDLTIDGIGGLVPGNLFKIDFLPEIYRKYTYFIIMSINHSIATTGWSTSMNAKMKLDFPKMIKDGLIKTGDEQNINTDEDVDDFMARRQAIIDENEAKITPEAQFKRLSEKYGVTIQQIKDYIPRQTQNLTWQNKMRSAAIEASMDNEEKNRKQVETPELDLQYRLPDIKLP